MDDVIITHQLTRKYGKQFSVNGLHLKVPKGSIYGFLGPNGAGKTTTIRMLTGLIRPDMGEIHMFGQAFPKHRISILQRIGALVESPSYYGHLSGRQNLKLICTLLNIPQKKITEVLQIVRLLPYADKAVKKYSLGMKQRLAIASALIREPDLLILDEPTNGLDPAGIEEIRGLMLNLVKEKEMTILLSSHILSEVEAVVSHVGIINQGSLLFQGTIGELRSLSQQHLLVEVAFPDAAYHSLTDKGYPVVLHGTTLQIPIKHENEQREIFHLLEDYQIRQVKIESHSLEQIFLDMTGRGSSV
ncbi:ABC transporter ATP-binding protein [Paenibacillus sp. FSL H7-0331]|uniref:ABC transporter ATP-binding protein n=1 Tax=Paenibacillus sp. FSL H7-0331 TaxID=1920421 RepID=UPI00096F65DA|nr:ATP-binding cassette domain-containing protein [Paenibacillus sp. FSL H7-0331]OMF06057.1 bacitracin ABC transporter ATP-binding protein [Paenibacillus sp. FSL H7-0331]